jgi:hypothetical protein
MFDSGIVRADLHDRTDEELVNRRRRKENIMVQIEIIRNLPVCRMNVSSMLEDPDM